MYAGTQCTSTDRQFAAEVLVDGVPQNLFRRMDGALFVEAVVGAEYVVRVTNATGRRVETLLAIDGRNTQDDEPADLTRSRGLVMNGSADFRGWRDDHDTVNAFVFTEPQRAIAAQATEGGQNNVGVIGLAIYREQVAYRGGFESMGGGYETMKGGGLESFGAATRSAPASYATRGGSVGTGMGHAMTDRVGTTTFTRAGDPTILVIRYDTHAVLDRMGLLVAAEPDPFPGAPAFTGRYQRA